MASSSGLTRRRGGAGGAAGGLESEDGSRVSSPAPTNRRNDDNRAGGLETSYESGENGHKIAFDPRDISESAERNKQPKLTLMEEILLMGLKDKQVTFIFVVQQLLEPCLTGHAHRDISPSGTTTSPMLSEAASSSNWLSAGG